MPLFVQNSDIPSVMSVVVETDNRLPVVVYLPVSFQFVLSIAGHGAAQDSSSSS